MVPEKLPTNTPVDSILSGGIENNAITNFYGPAGCGKTNIAISSAIVMTKTDKSVLYIDTEGSFSVERFMQMGGTEELLKKIIFIEPHSWAQQHTEILELEKHIEKKNIGLIIVDSMVSLYRLEMDEKTFQKINRQLATQYSLLSKIARTLKVPSIITNQVYGLRTKEGEKIELTSKTISRYWSKALVEIKKAGASGHRIAIVRKHRSVAEGKTIEFKIEENGLKEVKFLGII
jgi:DNA repair protein RadB